MGEKQGYFSLIQYSPYPERNEFINIGLAVFSVRLPHVVVRFSESASRVNKAFGLRPGKHFELEKQSLADRLNYEFQSNINRSGIERFISLRSGNIRLSAPKSVLIEYDVQSVADDLFERLVEPVSQKKREQSAPMKLKQVFSNRGVEKLLDKPDPVILPQGVTLKAPYAYQNGSYNLISAISVRDDPNQSLSAASKQATEGFWLSRMEGGSRKLIVVGDVENQQPIFVSALNDLMTRNNVDFYPLSGIDPLVEDILKNAGMAKSSVTNPQSNFLN